MDLSRRRYCDHCFRLLSQSSQRCQSCSLVCFCSPNCISSHTPWLCESLRRLHQSSSSANSCSVSSLVLRRGLWILLLEISLRLSPLTPSWSVLLLFMSNASLKILQTRSSAEIPGELETLAVKLSPLRRRLSLFFFSLSSARRLPFSLLAVRFSLLAGAGGGGGGGGGGGCVADQWGGSDLIFSRFLCSDLS
ncbi:Uncharacterized protein Rs2_38521 [Raphanus sativus]|nr:Uncharacterized protein Rs2_38521 [Raphanus sativus]